MIYDKEVGRRSYLDALNDYESATQEAIALARRKPTNSGSSQHPLRDLDFDAWPEPAAVRAVMRRWHHSLMAVLKAGQEMFQDPLDLTTEDIAKEREAP